MRHRTIRHETKIYLDGGKDQNGKFLRTFYAEFLDVIKGLNKNRLGIDIDKKRHQRTFTIDLKKSHFLRFLQRDDVTRGD